MAHCLFRVIVSLSFPISLRPDRTIISTVIPSSPVLTPLSLLSSLSLSCLPPYCVLLTLQPLCFLLKINLFFLFVVPLLSSQLPFFPHFFMYLKCCLLSFSLSTPTSSALSYSVTGGNGLQFSWQGSVCVCVCACVRACVCLCEAEQKINHEISFSKRRRRQWALTRLD